MSLVRDGGSAEEGGEWAVGGVVGGAIAGAVLVWLLRRRLGDAEGAGSGAARAEAMGG